jgi:hypothetical protein
VGREALLKMKSSEASFFCLPEPGGDRSPIWEGHKARKEGSLVTEWKTLQRKGREWISYYI